MKRLVMLVLAAAALCGPAFAQSLALRGPEGQTLTLTNADLAALPRVTVIVQQQGSSRAFQGPLLSSVLAKVGADLRDPLRGPGMAQAVISHSADGYTLVFALAEADPTVRKDRIILADTVDGQPLGVDEGPFRLVFEGDLRPVRSARQLQSLEVRSLTAQR